MNVPPFFSVLVPVYNAGRWLVPCIESVLGQTDGDFELLLVDDGSTDESGAVCDEYAARDARIRVISKENTGYGDSMNQGVAAARGTWIGICEPDDFCDTRMFGRLAEAAERHACDIAKANYCEHSDGSRRDNLMEILHGLPYRIPFSPRDVPQVLLVEPTIWAAVYRREFLLENGIELSRCFAASTRSSVVIIIPKKNADDVNDLLNPDGVLVIARPINRHLFHHYLQFTDCFRQRLLRIERENRKLKGMVEDIRLIDRAKLLLVTCLGMSEEGAHRYLEKQAMDLRLSKIEIAKQVIRTYEN